MEDLADGTECSDKRRVRGDLEREQARGAREGHDREFHCDDDPGAEGNSDYDRGIILKFQRMQVSKMTNSPYLTESDAPVQGKRPGSSANNFWWNTGPGPSIKKNKVQLVRPSRLRTKGECAWGAAKQCAQPREVSSPCPEQNAASASLSQCLREFETFAIDSAKTARTKTKRRRPFRSKSASAAVCTPEACAEGGSQAEADSNSFSAASASCSQEARKQAFFDISVDSLAEYLEESIIFPKKMSYMAEMMYT